MSDQSETQLPEPIQPLSKQHTPVRWWAYATLVVLGLIAFWPSVWFDFVNWDDPSYITHNELIKSWSPSNLAGIATETVTRNYAPLTIFSYLVDHTLWGDNPCGYHATNVLLHLINGVLVFLLVRQLSGSNFVGWTTAALFLVHPVQIETVAWVSSRKGLLSATFMLAALIVRLKPNAGGKQDLWYIGWLIAALLSKALAVVVPAIVLCYDLWVRRQTFADAFVRQVVPGFLCVQLLLKTMGAQTTILGGLRGHMDLSFLQILAVDTTILWRYIGMLFYPTDLCVLYDPAITGIGTMVGLAVAGWLVVGFAIWKVRKTHPIVLWSAAAFMLLLLPVLNFYKITTLMNDRYLYLPCICVFAVVAAGLNRLLTVSREEASGLLSGLATASKCGIAAAAVSCAAVVTSQHLPVWQSPETLWDHAMTKAPQLTVVRIQKALTQHDRGQRREAIRTLQWALVRTEPDELDRDRIRKMLSSWVAELSIRTVDGGRATMK